MRKLWSIIALIIMLAALIGAYAYLTKHPQDKSTADKKSENKIDLLKLDQSKINKINIRNEKGNIILEKKSSKWIISQKESIKLDDQFVGNIVENFVSLSADRLVDKDSKDLEQYGLKTPKAVATAYMEDGSSKTINLGNETSDNSRYYIMIKDDPNVYAISSSAGLSLNYNLNDIRDRNISSLNNSDIKYFKFVNANNTIIEIKANDKNELVITTPNTNNKKIDDNNFQDLLSTVTGMKIKDFIEDNNKSLSKYGLDKPSSELLIKDSKNELHIYFGKDISEGSLAFKLSGNPEIYSIDKSVIDSLTSKALNCLK